MRNRLRCWGQVSVTLASVALFTLSCESESEVPKGSTNDADGDVINQLVARYDVPRNFYQLFPERPEANVMWEPFSIRVSEVLTEIGDQPLVFVVQLDDIVGADSGYTAIFSSGFGFRRAGVGAFSGQLELACDTTQKKRLVNDFSGSPLGGFAVVASIRGFRRPRFQLEVSDGAGEYDCELAVEASGPIILTGRLIEARYLRVGIPMHDFIE